MTAELLPARPRAIGPAERMLGAAAPAITSGGNWTVAAQFTPTVAGVVTHLRYWHVAGHAQPDTHALSLWLTNGTKLVGIVDTPPAADPAGFREVQLTDPVAVDVGTPYRVSYSSDSKLVGETAGMPVSLAPNLTLGRDAFYAAGRDVFPASTQVDRNQFADVVFRTSTIDPPATVSTPRAALAELLTAVAGDTPVLQAPLRQAAPPVFAIAPGTPYLRPSSAVPGCRRDWRIDVWCITTREDVAAMDTLDAMADAVADALPLTAAADAHGFVWLALGVERANIDTTDLAGLPGLAAIVQLRASA